MINTAAHFINVNCLHNQFVVLTLHNGCKTHFHPNPSSWMQVRLRWSSPPSFLHPLHRRWLSV